ncbi:hypothetical protein ACFSKU_13315 [Pontibacter silvestris]|uniref:Rhamnogalacturonan endolyase n=1 Tax=Pontibacter silvestris TaxID=2305183 RepID=A0ABW4WZ52_9BACT|nr:hypothetical protein [Pontibacter silvestris]MCC9135573.1 hypothetical protein [Pontibacter silvestris]
MSRLSTLSFTLALYFAFMFPDAALAQRHMEYLDRGLVAVHTGGDSVYVGWRLLGTEPENITFNLYRKAGGSKPVKLNKKPITESTNFIDTGVNLAQANAYFVKPVLNGKEQKASETVTVWEQNYLSVPLQTPTGYTPNDAAVADLNGNGQYEIVVHMTGRSRDTPSNGFTDEPIFHAYKLDGTLLWKINLGKNIREAHLGAEMWWSASGRLYSIKGKRIGNSPRSTNFLVWWDGDLTRELLDGNHIDKWDYENEKEVRLFTAEGTSSNNGTKANPALSADLFGDWREEVVFRTNDNKSLRIYTTTIPTRHRLYTLMHDPQYRLSIAWQNVGYNQPPHTSFYLGHDMKKPPKPNITVPNNQDSKIKAKAMK